MRWILAGCSRAFTTVLLTSAVVMASVARGEASDLRDPRSANKRPNIIIIFADDLGYGDLACYGHGSFKTPNLDRLASRGARFTNFDTTCPYCAPSRASLLTGRYQFRSGVTRNPAPDAGINDVGLPDSEITLAEALKTAGYRTICIGKWHLGHKPPYYPIRHGFDEYLGILYSNDMRPIELIENDKVVEYPVVQSLLTKKYTQRAIEFIERNKHWPFFVYLPYAMPHKPLAASEEFYTPDSADDLYADVIRELDWGVGRILAKLEELKLERSTLVIFTSDNGPWFGGSTGGLRGMKGMSWEGGFRVPMIASMPGTIPAGHVSHEMAATIDLFPTVLKLCTLSVPQDRVIDGRDILPLMTSDARSPHEALFALLGSRVMTVRSGRWKLHLRLPGRSRYLEDPSGWVDPRAPDGVTIIAPYEQYKPNVYPGVLGGDPPRRGMLFDLDADRAEQKNVADEHPEVVARLRALYERLAVPQPARGR